MVGDGKIAERYSNSEKIMNIRTAYEHFFRFMIVNFWKKLILKAFIKDFCETYSICKCHDQIQ